MAVNLCQWAAYGIPSGVVQMVAHKQGSIL